MPLNFVAPTSLDLGNWGEDKELRYAVHLGNLPVEQGTEPVERRNGSMGTLTYREYADCTVYVAEDGYLAVEFYREGEGMYPGNPENGEEIVTYCLQCVAIEAAKSMANIVMVEDTERVYTPEYFAGFGFERIVA